MKKQILIALILSAGVAHAQTDNCEQVKASLEVREAGIIKLDKLYLAQVARRPSSFDLTLEGMGRNKHEIGLGGAFKGVAMSRS